MNALRTTSMCRHRFGLFFTGSHVVEHVGIRRVLSFAAVVVLAFVSGVARAEEEPPVVVFLSGAAASGAVREEQEIATQISIALPNYKVVIQYWSEPYACHAMPAQCVDTIKQWAAGRSVVAIVWVSDDSGAVVLHLAVLGSDYEIVRMVETEDGTETPEELAILVQEVLGQKHLFRNSAPPNTSAEVAIADDVSKRTAPSPPKKWKRRHDWSLVVSLGALGGLISHRGPTRQWMGTMALERSLEKKWILFPEVSLLFSRQQTVAGFSHRSVGGGVGVGAGYPLRFHRFALTPLLSVAAVWQRLTVGIDQHGVSSFHFFSGRLAFALRLQWLIAKSVLVAVAPGAILYTAQQFFHRKSNDEILYTSPRIAWQALAVFGWHL